MPKLTPISKTWGISRRPPKFHFFYEFLPFLRNSSTEDYLSCSKFPLYLIYCSVFYVFVDMCPYPICKFFESSPMSSLSLNSPIVLYILNTMVTNQMLTKIPSQMNQFKNQNWKFYPFQLLYYRDMCINTKTYSFLTLRDIKILWSIINMAGFYWHVTQSTNI